MEWCSDPYMKGGTDITEQSDGFQQKKTGFLDIRCGLKSLRDQELWAPIEGWARPFDKINFANASKHNTVKMKDLTLIFMDVPVPYSLLILWMSPMTI